MRDREVKGEKASANRGAYCAGCPPCSLGCKNEALESAWMVKMRPREKRVKSKKSLALL